jgi:hypothetical protein
MKGMETGSCVTPTMKRVLLQQEFRGAARAGALAMREVGEQHALVNARGAVSPRASLSVGGNEGDAFEKVCPAHAASVRMSRS